MTLAYRPVEAVMNNEDMDDNLKVGGQIDLLIDCSDKTVTVCEMRYSDRNFQIDKAYDKCIRRLREVEHRKKLLFRQHTILHIEV